MPKAPILNREGFYDVLGDGSFRDLDWNLVNTSVGACIEPRQVMMIPVGGNLVHVDAVDVSFNRRTQMDEDAFFRLFGTSGRQIPIDFTG